MYIRCPNCGYEGKAKRMIKDSLGLEIVLWLLLIVPVGSLAIVGCTPWSESSRVVNIVKSGQVTVDDNLRIGLGYVDIGAEHPGRLAAGLWISVREDKSKNRRDEFYEGQRFQVDKYSLHVEKIWGGNISSVRIRVTW